MSSKEIGSVYLASTEIIKKLINLGFWRSLLRNPKWLFLGCICAVFCIIQTTIMSIYTSIKCKKILKFEMVFRINYNLVN